MPDGQTSAGVYIHPDVQLRKDMSHAEHPGNIPTLLPFTWYFATPAFGYLNIAAGMGLIGYGELQALADSKRNDNTAMVLSALKQHNSAIAHIAKALTLSRSFFGTDSLEMVLEAALGGITSDKLEEIGARKQSGYEEAHNLSYHPGLVQLDAMATAMELAMKNSNATGSHVTLQDIARAAIPFAYDPKKQFDDAEIDYLFQNFYVNFGLGGLDGLLGKNAPTAMLVTSPFSKGKIYVGLPENNSEPDMKDYSGFAHYRHFVEIDWSDYHLMTQVMQVQKVAQLLGSQQKRFPAHRLVTGNDVSAVGTLEFALVPMSIGPESYAELICESRSLAYQQPDGFKTSETIMPVTRWLKMNELYAALEPLIKERVRLIGELRQKAGN